MPNRKLSAEVLDQAEELLRDPNMTYVEVGRRTGISTDTLSRRFPRDPRPGKKHTAPVFDEPAAPKAADPRPGTTRPPSGSKRRRTPTGPTDEELEALLRRIAKAPAIPMMAFFHCDYCTTHFITSAPEVAAELMQLAEDEPDLRDVLEFMWREWRKFAWASVLAAWMGVPLAHHVLPGRYYNLLVLLAGMPAREATSSHDPHFHAPAPPASSTTPASDIPATPFSGMSPSELIATAEAAGFNLAEFGISPDVVADMLRAEGQPVAEDPERAGTPEDFIETDPTELDATLAEIDDLHPDPAYSAVATVPEGALETVDAASGAPAAGTDPNADQ